MVGNTQIDATNHRTFLRIHGKYTCRLYDETAAPCEDLGTFKNDNACDRSVTLLLSCHSLALILHGTAGSALLCIKWSTAF